MQQSIKSRFLTTQQSSSCKSYLVKRKIIQITRSKSPKEYFHSSEHKQHNFQTINKNLSTISVNFDEKNPNNQVNTKFNKISLLNNVISTQKSSQISRNSQYKKSDIKSKQITLDILSRQRSSQSLMETPNQKKIKNKSAKISTISDNDFNNTQTKKQILIQDSAINPQSSKILPKIQKNTSKKFKTQISERLKNVSLYRNNSLISQTDPYYVLSKQAADKLSIQKLIDYKKFWKNKQKKRKQINMNAKNSQYCKSFSFNTSLLDKSLLKSGDITIKYNEDVQKRKQKCYWEQQLRGNRKKYVTLGQISNQIQGLKGIGQNMLQNIEVKPAFSKGYNNFLCQEVYKYHK